MMVSKKQKGLLPDEEQVKLILKNRQKARLDHLAWYKHRGKVQIRQDAIEFYIEAHKHIPEKE